MHGEHHILTRDFPHQRDRIHRLKLEDPEFARQMEEYNRLTKEIEGLESRDAPVTDERMEELKRQRVHLKDTLAEWLDGGG